MSRFMSSVPVWWCGDSPTALSSGRRRTGGHPPTRAADRPRASLLTAWPPLLAELGDGQAAPAPVLHLDLFDHDERRVERLVQNVQHQLARALDEGRLLLRRRRHPARGGTFARDLDRDHGHD